MQDVILKFKSKGHTTLLTNIHNWKEDKTEIILNGDGVKELADVHPTHWDDEMPEVKINKNELEWWSL